MYSDTPKAPLIRGNLLSHNAVAEAVARRAGQVGGLIIERRRIALAYRRTLREDQRIALEQIDHDLAAYNIDIPAIQRCTNRLSAANSRARS